VQVFVNLRGIGWRRVFVDDDRAKAEAWARENVRQGGAVSAIELRERGNGSVVLWRAT
jgi:glutathione synthase/RimK-type ligase-like ATP-grasp enzyme